MDFASSALRFPVAKSAMLLPNPNIQNYERLLRIGLGNSSFENSHVICSGEGQLHFFSNKFETLLEVENEQGGMI